MKVTFQLNGNPITVDAVPDKPLLWVLREDLGLTGTKFGCGRGLCGACTLHVDGEATRACAFPIKFADGKDVETIENHHVGSSIEYHYVIRSHQHSTLIVFCSTNHD